MFSIFFYIINFLLINLIYILLLLFIVAYFTLLERKIMASIQRRTGPKVVGFYGLLQPLADGVKLLTKEIIIPQRANKFLFLFAPFVAFFIACSLWGVVIFCDYISLTDLDFNVMYIFAFSSLNVYSLIISGWASNSKYAFLGAIRSTAQVISYELNFGFIVLMIVLLSGSLHISDIVEAQLRTSFYIFPLLPFFIIFVITILAETNRIPFDLSEAEAEIVAGYNVEYSSIIFALFFLAEYANMLFMSYLIVIFFLGGWGSFLTSSVSSFFLIIKMVFFIVFFIIVRSTLPRYRYDQLMALGWKIFLPITIGFFFFYLGIALFLPILPFSLVYICM